MNHIHTCPECDYEETCTWGYDDDECAIFDLRVVLCESCRMRRQIEVRLAYDAYYRRTLRNS